MKYHEEFRGSHQSTVIFDFVAWKTDQNLVLRTLAPIESIELYAYLDPLGICVYIYIIHKYKYKYIYVFIFTFLYIYIYYIYGPTARQALSKPSQPAQSSVFLVPRKLGSACHPAMDSKTQKFILEDRGF